MVTLRTGYANPNGAFFQIRLRQNSDKCKIGDVVTPRVVVDDTQGVAQAQKRLKRPKIYPPPHPMIQLLQNYRLVKARWHENLKATCIAPRAPRGKAEEYRKHVAKAPSHHEAAIYSS